MNPHHTTRTPVSARVLVALVALVAAAGAAAQDNARFMRECYQWVEKKGYSVDYIEQRTGERPAGNMAANWIANLEPKDALVGDVVFMTIDDTKAQRAEVVDAVLKNEDGSIRAFRTSSMNVGKMVEPVCRITENFGKVVHRTVPFDRVIRAWRPKK